MLGNRTSNAARDAPILQDLLPIGKRQSAGKHGHPQRAGALSILVEPIKPVRPSSGSRSPKQSSGASRSPRTVTEQLKNRRQQLASGRAVQASQHPHLVLEAPVANGGNGGGQNGSAQRNQQFPALQSIGQSSAPSRCQSHEPTFKATVALRPSTADVGGGQGAESRASVVGRKPRPGSAVMSSRHARHDSIPIYGNVPSDATGQPLEDACLQRQSACDDSGIRQLNLLDPEGAPSAPQPARSSFGGAADMMPLPPATARPKSAQGGRPSRPALPVRSCFKLKSSPPSDPVASTATSVTPIASEAVAWAGAQTVPQTASRHPSQLPSQEAESRHPSQPSSPGAESRHPNRLPSRRKTSTEESPINEVQQELNLFIARFREVSSGKSKKPADPNWWWPARQCALHRPPHGPSAGRSVSPPKLDNANDQSTEGGFQRQGSKERVSWRTSGSISYAFPPKKKKYLSKEERKAMAIPSYAKSKVQRQPGDDGEWHRQHDDDCQRKVSSKWHTPAAVNPTGAAYPEVHLTLPFECPENDPRARHLEETEACIFDDFLANVHALHRIDGRRKSFTAATTNRAVGG